MIRKFTGHWSLVMVSAALLVLTPALRADDDDKGKKKGKDQKPNVIQLDLSKLPPDLAKALQKYATESEKPNKKAPSIGSKPSNVVSLPPGLANKSPDHPGRVAWLKAHAATGTPAPSKGDKGKGSDLESRLDRLMMELDELRREIRKKK